MCVCCRTRAGESAYFRVYIPPIQEFITLDSTLTEIYRIRNRLEGRREYQAFRFGVPARRERPEFHVRLVASTTVRFVGWLRHYSLSLSIYLSLFLVSARITRGKMKASFHRGIEPRSTEKLASFLLLLLLLIYLHFVNLK